jgi:hypothetical protein
MKQPIIFMTNPDPKTSPSAEALAEELTEAIAVYGNRSVELGIARDATADEYEVAWNKQENARLVLFGHLTAALRKAREENGALRMSLELRRATNKARENENHALRLRVAELETANAALAQDRERLDWLQFHEGETFCDNGHKDTVLKWSCTYRPKTVADFTCVSGFTTLRAAIDAARAPAKADGEGKV